MYHCFKKEKKTRHRLNSRKPQPSDLSHRFCRSSIWAELSYEIILSLMSGAKIPPGHPAAEWTGLNKPRGILCLEMDRKLCLAGLLTSMLR